MKREQFTFYRSYYEAIRSLSNRDFLAAIEVICKYSLYGIYDVAKLSKKALAAIESIRPIMDNEIRMSVEGRRSTEYRLWRKAVFMRDGFTCQICGSHGVMLNAHHIKSYAAYPELRFDISNGITLCEVCHKKLHRR